MTDKQLRKAKKSELIEMLYYMRKELDRLSEENEGLRTRLDTILGKAVKNAANGTSTTTVSDKED